ncbi:hypothetical protein OAF54_03565 [bacterium]|nr:hypothetical protein [bacterium]
MKQTIIEAVFRKYPNGEIITLFPYMPARRNRIFGYFHGSIEPVNYKEVVNNTKPATIHDRAVPMRALQKSGILVRTITRINGPRYFNNFNGESTNEKAR